MENFNKIIELTIGYFENILQDLISQKCAGRYEHYADFVVPIFVKS